MNGTEIIEEPVDMERGEPALSGWLLLFVVWLGLVGPLYSLALNGYFVMQWQRIYPEAGAYYGSWHFWWFIAAREAFRIGAALAMTIRRSADAVWFAILVLWFTGPCLATATWLLSGPVIMPSALVRSSAIAAAATLFLLRSRQVRAVYAMQPKLRMLGLAIGPDQTAA
jgi:hypothetical protein